MWYRVDYIKFIVYLLPPILRSNLLVAFIGVLILPLCEIYKRFLLLKTSIDAKLNGTGNVICLERVLNDTFFLRDRQIRIETPEEKEPTLYYLREEETPIAFCAQDEGQGVILTYKGENISRNNILIKIPTFLCTSLESEQGDKYGWRHLRIIKILLNAYKPAGRTSSIELYDYE